MLFVKLACVWIAPWLLLLAFPRKIKGETESYSLGHLVMLQWCPVSGQHGWLLSTKSKNCCSSGCLAGAGMRWGRCLHLTLSTAFSDSVKVGSPLKRGKKKKWHCSSGISWGLPIDLPGSWDLSKRIFRHLAPVICWHQNVSSQDLQQHFRHPLSESLFPIHRQKCCSTQEEKEINICWDLRMFLAATVTYNVCRMSL